MRVSDYTYKLPEALIAQFPPKVRGKSRLLVLDRQTGLIEHRRYDDFADYLQPGDLVVLNNTKVVKARLSAVNAAGQPRELLLLEDHHTTDFTHRKALYRGKVNPGETLSVQGTNVTVDKVAEGGIAELSSRVNLLELAEHEGSVPLPPYMHREATAEDVQRYQTVFAKEPGSVAAPTASLNFTHELERKLIQKGVSVAYLTLHVGLGTFLPIRSDDIAEHVMHSEYFEIPAQTVKALQKIHKNRSNIVAAGTTVARTLEFAADTILAGEPHSISGEANIFIYPGYKFKLVNSLLTNFHAPKSTVLMLAAAKAGWENLDHAYREAIKEKYAFLSYGDSMFIQ
ncbi:MAG TPA: tRNA preQ1(34) S-adenosylmethionine ribosyltransferase-isomerase QueA [Candidatus Limnocylindria bacterium]|nr:tRNA preQ1(34) S-adenosylmethionine ribosyltransferase-isomerase QueA [Candidatus Limnocylindria bacterium]